MSFRLVSAEREERLRKRREAAELKARLLSDEGAWPHLLAEGTEVHEILGSLNAKYSGVSPGMHKYLKELEVSMQHLERGLPPPLTPEEQLRRDPSNKRAAMNVAHALRRARDESART